MRSNDWLQQAQQKLEQAGVDSSRLDSLILLEHVSGKNRAHILASPDSPLTEEDDKFFKEAEKWGVLQAIESTKNKSSASAAIFDYVLNPVYSPFFLISYRKGRKIEIESSTIRQMYLLGETAITGEVRRKMRLSGLEDSTVQPKQATLL